MSYWAVGTSLPGGAWMLEGIFETEELAVANCEHEMFVVYPVPVNEMCAKDVGDAEVIYWPHLQTREEGIRNLEEYRASIKALGE